MVDSNLQREKILPSEKAFAYKMRLEAMKHQGRAEADTSDPLEQYILRFERDPKEQPELSRFHLFDAKGNVKGVRDMEIVDYLVENVQFFVVGITNMSSISLQDLNKRFYATGMYGKRTQQRMCKRGTAVI